MEFKEKCYARKPERASKRLSPVQISAAANLAIAWRSGVLRLWRKSVQVNVIKYLQDPDACMHGLTEIWGIPVLAFCLPILSVS